MNKYFLLTIFAAASTLVVKAQPYIYANPDFSVGYFNDFSFDEERELDTLDFGMHTLAYYSDGDTATTTMRFNFVGRGGSGRSSYPQTQVVVRKKQESMREIQSQRIAFFTSEMSLSPEEAQVFWPLYNQYTEKKNKLVEKQKEMIASFTEERIAKMTKSEAEATANAYLKLQQQESDLLQEYHKKYLSCLSPQKVMRLYKAEKDFMQDLLWHLRSPGKDW